LYQHVKERRQSPFPFVDNAKLHTFSQWEMALEKALSNILHLSPKISAVLRSAPRRAQKKHQNRMDSDAYTDAQSAWVVYRL
jgi:hypothetical protein